MLKIRESLHIPAFRRWIGLGCLMTTTSWGEVTLAGGAFPGKTVPFREGLGLIELLDGSRRITCSRVDVARSDQTRYTLDLKALLRRAGDWPLHDGDIVTVPEHVFPCMSEATEAALCSLFRDYRLIETGLQARPPDWAERIAALDGSREPPVRMPRTFSQARGPRRNR